MKLKTLDPTTLAIANSTNRQDDDEILIPSEELISQMLDEGYDSFLICQKTGCSAVDVVNAERRKRGLKKLMSGNPELPRDEQVVDPERRLLLFPPVD